MRDDRPIPLAAPASYMLWLIVGAWQADFRG